MDGSRYHRSVRFTRVCVATLLLTSASCGSEDDSATLGQSGTIPVSSAAFAPGGQIPAKYDAKHGNVSPPLAWSGVPKGTQEIVVLVDSVPGSSSESQAHWLVYSLSPSITALPEGTGIATPTLAAPVSAMQGMNAGGEFGWSGPSPADGTGLYSFWVYALGKPSGLRPGATRDAALTAVQRAGVLGSGRLLGSHPK